MNANDLGPFGDAIIGLAEMHGRDATDTLVQLYWAKLKLWPLDEFLGAAEYLLSARFMPKPFDFDQLRRLAKPNAGEAWAAVLEHVRSGAHRSGAGIDEGGCIDRAVAALGGYHAIGFQDVKYLGAIERRFAERYAESVDVAEVRAALPSFSTGPLLSHKPPAIEALKR